MPSCVIEIHKSPLVSHKFCKILIKDFDIPYDSVQKLTEELNITFKSEYVDEEPVIRLTNYYYYGQTKSQKQPSIQIVLTNNFFEKGIAEDYSDVEALFQPDSSLPLLYTKCQSDIFSSIMSLLCRVDIREIKCL